MNPECFLQVATVRLEADVDALLLALGVRRNVIVGYKFEKLYAKVAELKSDCYKLDRRLEDAREKLEIVRSTTKRMPQVAAIRQYLRQRRASWRCTMPEEVLRDIAECMDNASLVLACECLSQSSQVRGNAVNAFDWQKLASKLQFLLCKCKPKPKLMVCKAVGNVPKSEMGIIRQRGHNSTTCAFKLRSGPSQLGLFCVYA
jgi:hypothetical protein